MIFLSLLMGAILQVVTPTAEPVYHEDFLREITQLSDKISLPDLFHVVRQRKERKISELSEKLTIPEFLRIVKQARNDERYDIDDEEESHLGCGRRPTVSTMKFLDRICEDCYSLYRDFDVYQMCRSDCFTSPYFMGCMNVMLVGKSTKNKASTLVRQLT